MKQIQHDIYEDLDFHERLKVELSTFPEKIVQTDGNVMVNQISTSYFIKNDVWHIDFFKVVPQFNETIETYKQKDLHRNIYFEFTNPSLNLEVKYIWYQKMFHEEWALGSLFNSKVSVLRRLTRFINEKYPSLPSFLAMDIEKVEKEWWIWLEQNGYSTTRLVHNKRYDLEQTHKTASANFLRNIYSDFLSYTDNREEWVKDRWDVRILNKNYGIDYNKSIASYIMDFTKIEHMNVRNQVKKYIKNRLLSSNNSSWAVMKIYVSYLSQFLSVIFSLEPSWKDLKSLKRIHIEKYLEWLHVYSKSNLKRRDANPERYVEVALTILNKFLEDIQRYEYLIAPELPIKLLLFPEDKPKCKKKSLDQIDFIPDYVLEQLFGNINDLHKEVIPVIWVAFKTGLRISDVLGLTVDCLENLNGKYSIVTDIEKTYVKGHRIPIDNELASILAVLIKKSSENSNNDNNPQGYIFVRFRGSRKGKPYSQQWISDRLNILAREKQIVDENGNLFHFKTHQFRHTYAVKMLNGGADILTVQELLAHASPEMTLRYAKLLDDTKRKAFESVINKGVFSFDLNGDVQEIKADEDIPEDILQALWQDHKLNAMDNPYGSCHARLKGTCPHMEAPPCLTCNGGSPCKDLAIGFSEFDIQKYELLVITATKSVEVAKKYGRNDVVEKQERNLERYQGILNNIREGNVIFGRQDRVKRKQGV